MERMLCVDGRARACPLCRLVRLGSTRTRFAPYRLQLGDRLIGVLSIASTGGRIMFPRIKARRARANPRVRFRPCLTVLESRELLATFIVNSLGDTGEGHGRMGDLRYCLTQANRTPGPNTIEMIQICGTIMLGGALPAISNSVTLIGPGAAKLTVQRASTSPFRLFTINSQTHVRITGLTLANGSIATGNGGAIDNFGALTLDSDTISGNAAQDGAGIANEAKASLAINLTVISGNAPSQSGGGIFNDGRVTVSGRSTLSLNSAASQAGGVFNAGTATISGGILSNNAAGTGGAVYNDVSGTLSVAVAQFSMNSATNTGGGLQNEGTAQLFLGSSFTANSAGQTGGGIQNDAGLTVNDVRFTSNSASGDGGGAIDTNGPATITNSTFTGNQASYEAGAILNCAEHHDRVEHVWI